MGTPLFGFEQYDDAAIIEPETLINDAVQSIEDNLPHRFAATIGEIAAMSGTQHPNGQLVILTADNSGAKAGSVFTRAAGKWRFTSGEVSNLSTFISSLGSNVITQPGAHFYDHGDSLPKTFVDTEGAWRTTAPTPRYATIAKTTLGQQVTTTVDEMTFQTLVDGDSAFWNAAAPTDITIPEDGRYEIRGQMRVNGGYIEIAFTFAVNDVINPYFLASDGDRATVKWPCAEGSIKLNLSAGDVVTMRMNRYGGVNTNITPTATWVQIEKIDA